jgi:hypothetical protein
MSGIEPDIKHNCFPFIKLHTPWLAFLIPIYIYPIRLSALNSRFLAARHERFDVEMSVAAQRTAAPAAVYIQIDNANTLSGGVISAAHAAHTFVCMLCDLIIHEGCPSTPEFNHQHSAAAGEMI